ncbi:hypothetical protein CLOM_g2618 [Closterium sp. NIES-68]|nr:hypothetical protein CLOM_g23605 [Closterium sp. NIES-68]GJP43122.1 hypothetical protein CLOM_g2618 [Closterium sp. NIES-68]GJP70727.1 hypothetical protein CLOP_g1637 [Closterium sp. NIES-67]GJP83320.1 hypothetical protein CLOP_g13482 [Closterium sp. NIES-67]
MQGQGQAEEGEREHGSNLQDKSTLPRDEASLRSSKAPAPPAGTLPRATSAPVAATKAPGEKPAVLSPGAKSLAELVRETDLEPDEEVARYGEMSGYIAKMAKAGSPGKGAAEGEQEGLYSTQFLIPDEEVKHQKRQQS